MLKRVTVRKKKKNVDNEGKQVKLKVTETEIKRVVRDYLEIRKWAVFPITQGLGSYRGFSDFIAIKDGVVLFVECKTERGIQSEPQKKFQQIIEAKGGNYLLVRGIEDLEKEGI